MGQHAFGGGATGEGHRYEDVSKTVTQQPRPRLEREISANHQARREPRSATPVIGGAGVAAARGGPRGAARGMGGGGGAAAGVGAGRAGSGKRKIKRIDGAVSRTAAETNRARLDAQGAAANAHQAERARTAALRAHGEAKSRQA